MMKALQKSSDWFLFYEKHQRWLILLPVLLVITYSLGFRSAQWGSDTPAYIAVYQLMVKTPSYLLEYEWLFTSIVKWMTNISQNPSYFFSFLVFFNIVMLTVNAVFLGRFIWGTKDNYRFIILLYLISFISPFFLSAQINVIRHGTALSFVILFYFMVLNRSSVIWLILTALIAQGFHSTSFLFIIPSIGLFFSYKYITRFLLVLMLLYVTGMTPYLVQKFSVFTGIPLYEKIMNYGIKAQYVRGLRYKFVIFTMGMGLFCDFFGRFFLKTTVKTNYFAVLKIYWLLCLPFLLVGYGAFSDRFLLPCWTLLSYLLAIVLKSIDGVFRLSILLWIFGLYVVATGYFIFNYISGM